MNDHPISPELLKRYLNGTCSAEEADRVEEWYATLNKGEADGPAFDQPHHFKKIQALLQLQMDAKKPPEETGKIRSFPTGWPRYAVAALVVLVAGLSVFFYRHRTQNEPGQAPGTVTLVNTQQRVTRHQLPDGSQVWLNPQARLEYTAGAFTGSLREVALEGEAFFDVTKDARRPFLVRSNALVVKVLGTSFNVKTTPDRSRYEVSVVTGKVSVSVPDVQGQNQAVLLLPRQQAVFETASGQLTSSELPQTQEQVNTWQPVSLTFEHEPLGEVVNRLEKKFGVPIRLGNPALANCRVRFAFANNRLAEILEITTQMLDASYQMQGDSIVINGAGCDNE